MSPDSSEEQVMGYGRSGYRRGYSSTRQTTGRIARPNARPGECRGCHEMIPAGAGQLWREESGAWSVVHRAAEWAGSPTSGQYTGGCPAETDRMNRDGNFGGPGGVRSERDNVASYAAIYAASSQREAPRRSYASTARRGKCEDAPCCGCCD